MYQMNTAVKIKVGMACIRIFFISCDESFTDLLTWYFSLRSQCRIGSRFSL